MRRRGEPEAVRAARVPLRARPVVQSLRTFDEHARAGVRRAVPLAILMHFLQVYSGRDAFRTFFAAYLVLLTPGKAPRDLAAVRVAGTVFGVVLLAAASLVETTETVVQV
jgi:hypothetical protein